MVVIHLSRASYTQLYLVTVRREQSLQRASKGEAHNAGFASEAPNVG